MASSFTENVTKPQPKRDFKPVESTFRHFIEKGGKYEPKKGRYHLYVSYGCPFATRTIITRKLKGLEDVISITVVSPRIGELGWAFAPADPHNYKGAEADPLFNSNHLRELYHLVDPQFQGPFTVPLLWDKETNSVVNNESADVVRILNGAFNEFIDDESCRNLDLYPEAHRDEIDAVNGWVLPTLNSGVYKVGFAKTQEAYETAIRSMFESFDKLEKMLEGGKNSLIGDSLTEADVRLWVTLIRFDVVYFGLFKCNLGMIRHNFPNLHLWMRRLYWNNNAFKSSTNFEHIKVMYFCSNSILSPNNIFPLGPIPDVEPLEGKTESI